MDGACHPEWNRQVVQWHHSCRLEQATQDLSVGRKGVVYLVGEPAFNGTLTGDVIGQTVTSCTVAIIVGTIIRRRTVTVRNVAARRPQGEIRCGMGTSPYDLLLCFMYHYSLLH